ncbi:hypothetical protein AAG906_025521 [Vitis piasezkii]
MKAVKCLTMGSRTLDVLAIMSPWRRRNRSYHCSTRRLTRSCCGGPSKAYFKATSWI